MAPFIHGGAEELASNLQKNLIIAGHEAEVLRIPFQWEPAETIPSQMLMVKALELINVDHVIALKFPAYLIRHPKKTLWLLHQYRQAYDLFDTQQTNLPNGEPGIELQKLIINADNECFKACRNIYANSHITKKRLQKYNNINGRVLLPPVNDPELFIGGESGDYIFAGGRINNMKRQHLLLEALVYANKRVKLIIAGPADSKDDINKLKATIEKYQLNDRVKLDIRFLPRNIYANYINNSAAVAYIPYDEDSLGYVAMEAATAKKALITTDDSGGILGLVKHKKTGWIAKPNAKSLAKVMNFVFQNKQHTKIFGDEASEYLQSLNINWPSTIKELLS